MTLGLARISGVDAAADAQSDAWDRLVKLHGGDPNVAQRWPS